jgi:hypothetical protein
MGASATKTDRLPTTERVKKVDFVYYLIDAGLLANLPAHMCNIYPVPSRYCNRRTHLHKDLVDIVESLMLTYGNANFIAKHMVSQLGKKYTNQVSTYLSKGPISSYPKEKDWMQKRFPPSGETL